MQINHAMTMGVRLGRSPFSRTIRHGIALAPLLLSLSLGTLALAETIDVSDSHGGIVTEYNAHWAELASRGVNVRIVGPCQSACTVLWRIFHASASA